MLGIWDVLPTRIQGPDKTRLHYTTLHYTTLHYTTLHYTTLHYTTLHYTTLHYTTLHYTTLHYTTLHYTTLHYTTLHYTTLHYTTLHSTTLHYTTLHCTTLHYTTLHYTTLHYTTLHYTTLLLTEWEVYIYRNILPAALFLHCPTNSVNKGFIALLTNSNNFIEKINPTQQNSLVESSCELTSTLLVDGLKILSFMSRVIKLKYSIEIDVYSSQTMVNKILNELFYPFRALQNKDQQYGFWNW